MYSFQANVGSRGYHVYKDTEWKPIYVNQLIIVSKKKIIMQRRWNMILNAAELRLEPLEQSSYNSLTNRILNLITKKKRNNHS